MNLFFCVLSFHQERRRSEDAQKLKEATEHLKHSQQVHAAQRRQVVHQPDMEYLETIRQSMDHQAKGKNNNVFFQSS